MPETAAKNEPFCSNCGYALTGLTESSKCPECGKPIVEVLTRKSFGPRGKRYQSKAKIFGWPVIAVAMGPDGMEQRGHAKGLIAIGDIATGGIAIGGLSFGVVALGGMACGVCALGGCAIGVLSAAGGLAISGGLAAGGGAFGTIANGGLAIGFIAQGGEAAGYYARDRSGATPGSDGVFSGIGWMLGRWPPGRGIGAVMHMLVPALFGVVLTAIIGTVAMLRLYTKKAE